jgi:D-alanyl-D-alanine carboxypeptidase
MNKQFTLIQWLVAFFVLFFLTISAADAKTKHKRKKKEKQYAVQTYGNISVMVTNITDNTITRSQNIDQVRALASMTNVL